MKYLWTACFALLLLSGEAQLLEEDTKILDAIQGNEIFELNAEELIFTYNPEEGWYKIRKEVYVDPVFVVDDKTLLAETSLENKEGEVIGLVIAEIEVVEGALAKKYRGKERFRAIIEGYIFKTKIKDDTHPEQWISDLLATKSRTIQLEGFKDLFKTYSFEERSFGEFTAFAYREENKTLSEDKDFRVIVIYRGEGTLYAVLTNAQTVTAPKIKTTWEDDPYKAIYIFKPTPSQAEVIQDEILYNYLAL